MNYELSKNANLNYVAQIVKITNIVNIPDKDSIATTFINGNHVIINKKLTKIGDIVVYFPVECKINKELLSSLNLFRDKWLNADVEKTGYFDSTGRVKCLKLSGQRSEGFILPVSSVIEGEYKLNDKFDTVKGIILVEKYKVEYLKKGKTRSYKYKDRILEQYFKFHYDTEKLGDNLDKYNLYDHIFVTYKMHGTSGISSYTKVKPARRWYDGLYELFFGIRKSVYENIFSSRTQVRIGHSDYDIWKVADSYVREILDKGMTMYYEIVGYDTYGKDIQKHYDYGCVRPQVDEEFELNKHFKIYVYRITTTNDDGIVTEWPVDMIEDYLNLYKIKGIESVPILSEGKVSEYVKSFDLDTYKNELYETLYSLYCDVDCFMCKNKVPAEGIVVRRRGYGTKAHKLKSFNFLYKESKQLDEGEIDLESMI